MTIFKKLLDDRTAGTVAAQHHVGAAHAHVQRQLSALAEAEVVVTEKIEGLKRDRRAAVDAAIEAGTDIIDSPEIAEIDAAQTLADTELRQLARKRETLEPILNEKARVLREREHRLRVERLEQAEASAHVAIATEDGKIVELGLQLSEAFSTRSQAEHDVFAINARLQHLGGVPRGTGNIAWDEAPLVAEFLRRHPEATRPVSFGEQPWGPFALTIPVLTPDRTTAALVADDEAASK